MVMMSGMQDNPGEQAKYDEQGTKNSQNNKRRSSCAANAQEVWHVVRHFAEMCDFP